jgi:phosphoglucosamine mutase
MENGQIDDLEVAVDSYLDHVLDRFGADLEGLRLGVDCANGAYSWIAPRAFEELGAEVTAIGIEPDGTNINVGCGATDLRALQQLVREERLDLGVAFDGDGDRMLAVDGNGDPLDGDQILAVLALDLKVDTVAVTSMTNFGFHRLMGERGIQVLTTDVGDRYVLEALKAEGAQLGGEQSGHIIFLEGHVTGDGLAGALLLCGALRGRTLAEAASVLERYPQALRNVRVSRREVGDAVRHEVDRLNAELAGEGRILVRPSGTEPVIRVLAEAETTERAEDLCATVAALVESELG